jgi:hypothetical protein
MSKKMLEMTKEEYAKKVKENKTVCICPNCPTYNECAEKRDEVLFCILGKSQQCIIEEQGCICPACPMTEKMGLENEYYCIRGTENEQRSKI